MSNIATPPESASKFKLQKTTFLEVETTELEEIIDQLDKELPKLTKFILPVSSHHFLYLKIPVNHNLNLRVEVCQVHIFMFVGLYAEEQNEKLCYYGKMN